MALKNQEIAARIRRLRGHRAQTAIAKAIDVGERTYQTWEGGEAIPGYRNLEKLAEFHGVTEAYILEGVEPTNGETPDLFDVAGTSPGQLHRIEAELAAVRSLLQALATRFEVDAPPPPPGELGRRLRAVDSTGEDQERSENPSEEDAPPSTGG